MFYPEIIEGSRSPTANFFANNSAMYGVVEASAPVGISRPDMNLDVGSNTIYIDDAISGKELPTFIVNLVDPIGQIAVINNSYFYIKLEVSDEDHENKTILPSSVTCVEGSCDLSNFIAMYRP